MSFTSGTFSNTAPVPYLINSIMYPAMNAAGWYQVSTNVASAPWLWNVYESPGTTNSLGNTWYMMLGWDTATNSQMAITMAESWNVASNQALYFPPGGSSTANALSNGQVNITVANCNSSVLPNVSLNVAFFQANSYYKTMPTSNVGYWLHTSIDEVIISTAHTSYGVTGPASNSFQGIAWYCGKYDSYMSTSKDIMPIALLDLDHCADEQYNFNGAGGGADPGGRCHGIFLREPAPVTSSLAFCGGMGYEVTQIPNVGTGTYGIESYSNKWFVTKANIIGRSIGGGGTIGLRGSPRYIWYIPNYYQITNNPTVGVSINKGDTIIFVDGNVTRQAVCINNGLIQTGFGTPLFGGVSSLVFLEKT